MRDESGDRVRSASNAKYARYLGRNLPEAERQEELLKEARVWADVALSEMASQIGSADELKKRVVKQTWDNFVPTHRYRTDFKLGYLEFASALWEEGSPSLEDRAIVALGNHPGSGTIRTEDRLTLSFMICFLPCGFENFSGMVATQTKTAP